MFIRLRASPFSNQTPSATLSTPPAYPAVVPTLWKVGLTLLVACLVASMVIAIVRLATTPTEILGDGFRGLPARHAGR
jgi:hypothetical protein